MHSSDVRLFVGSDAKVCARTEIVTLMAKKLIIRLMRKSNTLSGIFDATEFVIRGKQVDQEGLF